MEFKNEFEIAVVNEASVYEPPLLLYAQQRFKIRYSGPI